MIDQGMSFEHKHGETLVWRVWHTLIDFTNQVRQHQPHLAGLQHTLGLQRSQLQRLTSDSIINLPTAQQILNMLKRVGKVHY